MYFFKRIIAVLAVSILAVSAFAQGGSVITARLVEEQGGAPVGFATVSLTRENSDKAYKYAMSTDKGEVRLEGIRSGTYTLKAELLGYKTYTRTLSVKGDMALGDIKMADDAEVLQAAEVSAVGNPIIIKKDTVEYNASSFKTTDNDMLEDLLKKLPGVEVAEDGAITVNGQTISKITIDGKTFFLDDPQLASKNLPAKIINKVKVVEKKSEQAEFTGIDDGQEETVIDLSVRKGMMNGSFGNVMGGAGHDLPSSEAGLDDWRYQGAAFVGKFTEDTQLSLILNANNTNNRGFNDLSGSMMGGMRGGGGGMGRGQGGWGNGNGISTSYMAGINGAWDLFDKKMNLGGNYVFNGTEKDVEERSSKTTYIDDDYSLLYNNGGFSNTNTYGHRLGVRLEHKFSENTSILFEPQLNFGHGDYTEVSRDTTYRRSGGADNELNRSFNRNIGDNKNWSTSGFFLFRQRLGIPGRTFTANVHYNFSNNDLKGFNQSNTYTTEEARDSSVNQRFDQNRNTRSVSTRFTYTEPLGNHLYVEANYEYSWNRSYSNKDTYDSASAFVDPSNPTYNYTGELLNTTYTNEITNKYVNQSLGANLMYQNGSLRAQAGFSYKPTRTDNETLRNGEVQTYSSTVHNWSPQAMLWYDVNDNANLRLFYFGNSGQPSTSQLMPVPDNTNPLNISFGNPQLKPYFSHGLRGGFRYNNKKSFLSLNGRFGGSLVQNAITSAIMYGNDGVQYSMPYNGPDNFNADFNTFANIPISGTNFTIANMFRAGYSQSSSYVGRNIDMAPYYQDGEMDYDKWFETYPNRNALEASDKFFKNTTQTFSLTERLRLTYRLDDLELSASGHTRINKSWYTISDSDTRTFNNNARFSVNWTMSGPGLTLKSDFDYNWYNGYSTKQPDEFVLNAEIQKLLFKNKVTLALKGYDILDQAKNLTVSDSNNVHQETWNNTLGRYIIVSLTYRFGTFDRSKMRRGPGGPGGPPRR